MVIRKIAAYTCLGFIKAYQLCISPFFPDRCNFKPSCSEYMFGAIQVHGVFRGIVLGAKRLAKCTPNREFTYDPVPPKKTGHKNIHRGS